MRFSIALRCIFAALITALPFWAQFTSGSDGSDGALDYTGKSGTINFDPSTIPNHPAGSNVFNFTTITIPPGLNVRFSQSILNGPVIWLAQGPVIIGGTAILDLSGNAGGPGFPTSLRVLSTPGAGGYPGGAASSGSNKPTAGLGPGGGAPCSSSAAKGGTYTGNQFAIPLIGGSGGGGCGAGGGAGGGAILIASTISITNNGSIYVFGGQGNCNDSAAGSGGAVRLVAPSVSAGTILAYSNQCNDNNRGSGGAIRIESFNNPGGSFPPSGNSSPTVTFGSPFNTFVTPSLVPTLKVLSVGGVAVASPATGSFTVPDVVINTGSPVAIQVQGTQIPNNTTVTLLFFSDNGPDMTVTGTLTGTTALTTATVQFTFPAGYTRGFVSASF